MAGISSDRACPICGGQTFRISRTTTARADGRLGWENDSTLQLLGEDQVCVAVHACPRCLHAYRTPKFDTSILYTEAAVHTRAVAFQAYHPGRECTTASDTFRWGTVFDQAQREFRRFAHNARHLRGQLDGRTFEAASVKILDWGGGSGAVGDLYAAALRLCTGRQVESFVYDPAYSGNEARYLSSRDIDRCAPFDVLVIAHVLEHSHNPVEILSAAARHLSEGGIVLAEVPDERMNYLRCAAGRPFGLHYHVGWFTARSLKRTLAKAGLAGSDAGYVYESAYHGRPMTAIFGYGVKLARASDDESALPAHSREFLSLLGLATRKIAGRVFS